MDIFVPQAVFVASGTEKAFSTSGKNTSRHGRPLPHIRHFPVGREVYDPHSAAGSAARDRHEESLMHLTTQPATIGTILRNSYELTA